ncbi:hypothetical protein [Thiocystis violacea]|uniref:hypothetical protein n=1 Tax=Thiocystis violacea TaxID=13725 RepID=UPI001F5B8BD7|nr:hypothetical protein [Thiocystis violacea]
MEKLKDWVVGLKSAGVRQSGPALLMALENLRKAELSANRRLSILAALKVPILKTCAGLPKPYYGDGDEHDRPGGVTLEQRLNRLMFVNLIQAMRQFDHENPLPSARQLRKRHWAVRNVFRFANRQVRYAALWKTSMPAGTWRDLHELYLALTARTQGNAWNQDARLTSIGDFDPMVEYKLLLLLGFAAKTKESILHSEYFMEGLEAWAVQTRLEDPHKMLGRLRLILVEVAEDAPPRQIEGILETPFRGWVLQPPYPYIHEIEDIFGRGSFADQSLSLAMSA